MHFEIVSNTIVCLTLDAALLGWLGKYKIVNRLVANHHADCESGITRNRIVCALEMYNIVFCH